LARHEISYAGLLDGFFETKNPNLENIPGPQIGKVLNVFMDIWDILWTFGIF
jgi:hypothetical protein